MPADIVTAAVRSRMMSGIRGRDTKPELAIRSALHRRGFRFRLHRPDLPGKPDMTFVRYRAVIFTHGCFWHGHGCHLFKWPRTREKFWREKIGSNIERDRLQMAALLDSGWRVATIWECALKGRSRLPFDSIVDDCAAWLKSETKILELTGDEQGTTG